MSQEQLEYLWEAQKRHPGCPWKWREDWAGRRIRVQAPGGGLEWIAALLFNLVLWPFIGPALWDHLHGAEVDFIYPYLAFAAVALFALIFVTWKLLQRRKFGTSTMELGTLPGQLGGRLEGRILVSRRLRLRGSVQLTLACVHRFQEYRQGNPVTVNKILWLEDQAVPGDQVRLLRRVSTIPVSFSIPSSCQETHWDDDVRWEVRVHARVPGIDYRATFEVPVFDTVRWQALEEAETG